MDASEIKDAETLVKWLETRPQVDSVIIAHRIALRVGPHLYALVAFSQWRSFDLTELATLRWLLTALRCLLTAGVAGNASTPAVKRAAAASYAAASSAAASYSDAAYTARCADADYAAAAPDGQNAALAARAAAAAADAAAGYSGAGHNAARAAANAADAAAADTLALQSGTNPLTLPLWHNSPPPDWFTTTEAAMYTYWQTENPTHWAFWKRWYDAAISGRPHDWQLQHDIALIPDDVWQSGPGPVAEAIAKIEAEHKRRILENTLTAELRNLPKPSSTQVAITRAAMEQNRAALPPTFDAIEGLILLEIERLQQRNYTDDLDQAEARRQIRIFITLYDAICALRSQLPATAPVTEEQAAKSVSLVSLYANKFADLPRMKADEVVEGVWSTGRGAVQASLIGTTTLLGVSYGLPAIAALTIGAMVFAPKNATDLVKAAREAIAPKP